MAKWAISCEELKEIRKTEGQEIQGTTGLGRRLEYRIGHALDGLQVHPG